MRKKLLRFAANALWRGLISPLASLSCWLGRFGRDVTATELAELFDFRSEPEAKRERWTVRVSRTVLRHARAGAACPTPEQLRGQR
jgi:hypothetical protein